MDLDCLKRSLGNKFPEGPEAENTAWYRIFKRVETAPEVQHIHREFLFMRDYAGLSALFLVGLGAAALVLIPSLKVALTYCFLLFLQFVVARHAAATYGKRFVCTGHRRQLGEARPPVRGGRELELSLQIAWFRRMDRYKSHASGYPGPKPANGELWFC